jgi:hypothetical protein
VDVAMDAQAEKEKREFGLEVDAERRRGGREEKKRRRRVRGNAEREAVGGCSSGITLRVWNIVHCTVSSGLREISLF